MPFFLRFPLRKTHSQLGLALCMYYVYWSLAQAAAKIGLDFPKLELWHFFSNISERGVRFISWKKIVFPPRPENEWERSELIDLGFRFQQNFFTPRLSCPCWLCQSSSPSQEKKLTDGLLCSGCHSTYLSFPTTWPRYQPALPGPPPSHLVLFKDARMSMMSLHGRDGLTWVSRLISIFVLGCGGWAASFFLFFRKEETFFSLSFPRPTLPSPSRKIATSSMLSLWLGRPTKLSSEKGGEKLSYSSGCSSFLSLYTSRVHLQLCSSSVVCMGKGVGISRANPD